MPASSTNGKICYIELPASDVRRSAEFYEKVFGWRLRQRGDGQIAFDDTTGQVSGTWTRARAAADPGLLVYIMVDNAEATCAGDSGARRDDRAGDRSGRTRGDRQVSRP